MRSVLAVVVLLGGCLAQNRDPGPDPDPDPDPMPDPDPDPDPDPPPPPPPPAEMAILSPSTGTEITDHAPVGIDVEVKFANVSGLSIVVDGQPVVPGTLTITPTPTGGFCEPCVFSITWDANAVTEGTHAIAVKAFSSGSEKASAGIDLSFTDTPEILELAPTDNQDLTGVGSMDVTLVVLERGTVTAVAKADGVEIGTQTSSECRSVGCGLVFPWDTSTIAPGQHTLTFTITDGSDNVITTTRRVRVDDLVRVTSMQMATGFVDESGTLEMEVYVFDNATNALIGCVGSANGMGPVNEADIRYSLDAHMIDTTGAPLRAALLNGKQLRFEVWEDDDNPVCPTLINPSGNNFAGATPVRTRAQWEANPTATSFGSVVEMALLIDRPLSL